MHIETLLYMLIQSPKTRPPPYVPTPDWQELATRGKKPAIDEGDKWQFFPSGEVTLGLDDPEEDIVVSDAPFGWDNENPRRKQKVKSFLASKRPITNGEYALFLQHTNGAPPLSWTGSAPNWNVKTVFGPVPLSLATDWPVMASYDDLNAYAQWKGGRLPTEGELRLLHDYLHMKDSVARRTAVNIDAVNGHLTQNGVNTTPPQNGCEPVTTSCNGTSHADKNTSKVQHTNGLPSSHGGIYYDMTGKNVGFRRWHPTPLPAANKLSTCTDGGAWEWTSTTFDKHEGWTASRVYPGYSSTNLLASVFILGDFFDDKHKVVLGGSWATIPRIAGRRTFRNWYQAGYGFAWVGGRVVKDVVE